jgi:hypothetical protein
LRLILSLLILIFAPTLAIAACDNDCNKDCCAFGLCEPACKTSCEASKLVCQRTGGGVSLGHLPGPADVQNALKQSCAAGFQLITQGVILSQVFIQLVQTT